MWSLSSERLTLKGTVEPTLASDIKRRERTNGEEINHGKRLYSVELSSIRLATTFDGLDTHTSLLCVFRRVSRRLVVAVDASSGILLMLITTRPSALKASKRVLWRYP